MFWGKFGKSVLVFCHLNSSHQHHSQDLPVKPRKLDVDHNFLSNVKIMGTLNLKGKKILRTVCRCQFPLISLKVIDHINVWSERELPILFQMCWIHKDQQERSGEKFGRNHRLVQVHNKLTDPQVCSVSPEQADWAASGVRAVYKAMQFQGIN